MEQLKASVSSENSAEEPSAYVPPFQLADGQGPPVAANGGLSYMSFDQDGDAGTEKAMVDALVEANQRCTQAAMQCCSADRDMAHKVAAEIERSHQALIANLSGMR